MSFTSRLSRLTATCLFALALTACDDAAAPAEQTAAPSAAAPAASATADKPNFTVFSQPAYPPFSIRDVHGEMAGLDIDLLKAIAEVEDFTVTFLPHDLKGILDTLETGQADIVSGVHITAENQAGFDFSLPYLESNYIAMTNGKIKSFNELQGKSIAVKQGGASEAQLKADGVTDKIISTPSLYLAVSELKQGNAVAVYDVHVSLNTYLKENPGYHSTVDEKAGKISFGFAMVKENDILKSKLDKGLNTIRANGTYQQIIDKWSGYTYGHNNAQSPAPALSK